jgi:1-acyl-sn-glycerol-3-phosphate acyltransferase
VFDTKGGDRVNQIRRAHKTILDAGERHERASALLEVVRDLAVELHPHRKQALSASLESSLDRDLGIDSLGRVELLVRVERAFGMKLSSQLLSTAETPRDLLQAVEGTSVDENPPVMSSSIKPILSDETGGRPLKSGTLLDVLDWHVATHPERLHTLLYEDDGKEREITYAQLHEGAMKIASGLLDRNLAPGQTVAIMLPTSCEFLESFYGVLYAGGIPIPIYPPMRPSQIEDHLRRQAAILQNARVRALISVPEAGPFVHLLKPFAQELRYVVNTRELGASPALRISPTTRSQDIALLQYTSGSTGKPKGVILTHANLLANLRSMAQAAHMGPEDVFASWLPLYHDMGLIGAWLGSLYHAVPLVLMSPMTFLMRPERWLWAIHRHHVTMSGGPNFAYELCLKRIQDREIEGLDLSSWRSAFNGAEPVSAQTIQRFTERFNPYGFRPQVMRPVYGLAENTLSLTFSAMDREPRTDRIKREPFMRSGRAIPADEADLHSISFVSCGEPVPGHEVRIVDTMGYEVAERQEGQVQFRGPSATSGYFNNPDDTRRLIRGDWLDTGDRGYMAGGEIFLTGRAKDIIIRAGRNVYPQEIEEGVGHIAGIRKGCVAVFGHPDPDTGTERLVVLAETRETEASALENLRKEVENVVLDLLGAPPDDVVLAPPHTVLKTSSGKIRRAASRERYLAGHIDKRQPPVWWQIARLAVSGMMPRLYRAKNNAGAAAYAGYLWLLFGFMAPVAWLIVAVSPRVDLSHRVVGALTRLALRLGTIPLTVEGLDRFPRDRACVAVVNHTSYLDGVILVAALPRAMHYVVKRDLTNRFFGRFLFKRFGVQFVERYDARQGVDDAAEIMGAVKKGRSVAFFPEGTFGREPGLRPFRIGAFVVAAQAKAPIVPIAISGTRSLLRSGQWFPRWAALRVKIGTPLEPQGSDWAEIIRLRDKSREQILALCGEPDLEPAMESDANGSPYRKAAA